MIVKTKYTLIGKSAPRYDRLDKVTGQIKYTNDFIHPNMLHGALKTSPHAHAKIVEINKSKAYKMPGVRAILVGSDHLDNLGLYLCDKPPIARDRVRHYGEVVAVVVADSYREAKAACEKIEVTYEVMEPILSPTQALREDAKLIHPDLESYSHISPIHPKPGTNIANHTKIRKGNWDQARERAYVTIENTVSIALGDHVAMEPRVAIAQINSSGDVHIVSSTQAPFVVKGLMSTFFNIAPGNLVVEAPCVGGGFGGKAGIQLEGLAYLLSKAVSGRPVKLVNTREQDLITSPGHIGLEANVSIAASESGEILGMKLDYMFNSGAYADYAVNVSRAAAIACTGPYAVENVHCDSMCVYTTMPFATAYRGFGHIEMSFAVERAIDVLADKLSIDPIALRILNAIKKGDSTPVQSILNESTGDIVKCFERVKEHLEKAQEKHTENFTSSTIRGIGVSGLWKAPAMPTNTDAGALITFNKDGSCNLHTGIVEIGQGTKTGLAQIVCETLGISIEKVHIVMSVNTRTSPSDWATAASRGLYMAGIATYEACEDAKHQIVEIASSVLKVPSRELVLENNKVFVFDEPSISLELSDIVLGYVYPNGNAVFGQVIGRGRYIAKHLTDIEEATGKGHPDLEWTLGAAGVEVEVDCTTGYYKILNAVCCMDVGKVINPELAKGQTVGGMAMGIGYTTMEGFIFNTRGQVLNDSLRDFKIMRFGKQPSYIVDFIESPQLDGPFGARGLGEQSVIGMPGAIGNALSRATGIGLNHIPITPISIWTLLKEAKNDY
jgi:CO/xanthine dehydrogenase Mo-binding subunit